MTHKVLAVIAITTGLMLSACGNKDAKTAQQAVTNASWSTTAASDAKLAGVIIYADWCGSCKILDPKVQTARATGTIKGVSYIKLDYTKKDKAAFFAAADAAGVGAAVRAQLSDGIKTGQLLLVDIDDKKVVGVIKKDMSGADIAQKIAKAAKVA